VFSFIPLVCDQWVSETQQSGMPFHRGGAIAALVMTADVTPSREAMQPSGFDSGRSTTQDRTMMMLVVG
jgi:hypothetical protein